jgi:hypothetical protein
MRLRARALTLPAALLAFGLVAAPAHAQGRGHGKSHGDKDHGDEDHGRVVYVREHEHGPRKKYVPMDRAVIITRGVLVERGYVVERVERVHDTQVIYYYRGNRGRGRGHGPLERMVIRPRGDVYVIDDAPSGAMVDLRVRLPL